MRLFLICLLSIATGPSLAGASSYVGSQTCRSCHVEAFAKWQQSHHAAAMAAPTESTVKADFNDTVVTFHGISSRLRQTADGTFQVETEGDAGRETFNVAYTFGTTPLQQYLLETGEGRLQAFNVAWDDRAREAGGQRWFHLQPDETMTPDSPFFWTRHLQNWNTRCADCHSTAVERGYDAETRRYATRFAEISVGCEACHGPGGDHIKEPSASPMIRGRAKLGWSFRAGEAIAMAYGTANGAETDMCGGCHSRRDVIGTVTTGAAFADQYQLAPPVPPLYHLDGQIRDEVFVLGSFLQSRMHAAGVTCSNCHEPHSGELLAEGNALCGQCHESSVYDALSHLGHERGQPGSQCVDCHMPATTYMQVDDRRDHSFQIPAPQLTRDLDIPNACSSCHTNRSPDWLLRQRAFPAPNSYAYLLNDIRQQAPDVVQRIAAFLRNSDHAATQKAALIRQAGMTGARGLAPLLAAQRDSSSADIRAAVAAASSAVTVDEQIALLTDLVLDPVRLVRREAARAIAPRLNQLPIADARAFLSTIGELRTSLTEHSDNVGNLTELAMLESQLGKRRTAKSHFEQALQIEPNYVPALRNYADLARSDGDENQVGELLTNAMDFAPDNGAINYSFGLHLVRQKAYDEALTYLQNAAVASDGEPGFAYTYAVALENQGRLEAALSALGEAQLKWPKQINLRLLEILYLEKLGDRGRLEVKLADLAAIAPTHPQVQQLMGRYPGALTPSEEGPNGPE